jgi:hypothetical protein
LERQKAYKESSDQYLLAYQAYKELGNQEAAEEMKKRWLGERELISRRFPYEKN